MAKNNQKKDYQSQEKGKPVKEADLRKAQGGELHDVSYCEKCHVMHESGKHTRK